MKNVFIFRTAAKVSTYLATFLFFAGVICTLSSAASLSIPGGVTVTLQPPEAVAAGARWSIDGGPLQVSGASATGLAAGAHTIQFNNLAAWREPDMVQVLVIGGKQTAVTASYQALPRFYFRAVPEQRARVGTTVEFLVHTDDAADPQNPGPGAVLQMEATPPPAGALILDAPSGRITYTPSIADRLPFTVRLSTPQGVAGSFEMTPLNTITPEDAVIEYDRPLPNAESRDYMQISEVKNAPEVFNDATAETFTVSISGQTLVFAAGHLAHLHQQYSGRFNIRALRLYADKVIVRSPLILPQTQVTIHARELRFEGDGRIDTTPRTRVRVPNPIGVTASSANPADPGHTGGDCNVFVERFFSDSTTSTRFVLRGGGGGPAGQGRNGMTEQDLIAHLGATAGFLSAEWYALMGRAGNPICGAGGLSEAILYWEERESNRVVSVCGSRVTARGESAVFSSVPGRGGNGGTLRSTLGLAAFADLNGGTPGARGADYIGAATPTRRFIYRVSNTRFNPVTQDFETINTDTTAAKAPGANAVAAFGSSGGVGSAQVMPNPGTWLHSFSVRSILQFAKDAYLNGRITETRQLLGEYQGLLRAHQRIVGPNEQLTDEEFAENVNLDQLVVDVENLIHRIDSNLDYFGNPAGWVPMLSFEANFIAFQNEVEHSIPILYLTYWLNNAATNLQASLAATEQAKDNLEEERTQMETAFNEAQTAIPQLKNGAVTIATQIASFQKQLTNKLAQLEQRARDNVAERNKVPMWKKALGVLSVAADLVPIGQPTIGRIGAGIGLLAKIDPDKPFESAKAIAPQAFGVMSNKNISVCFGTNAPSNTSTNSTGTNDVKKAKQDRLKQLTTCAKFLGAELKEVAAIFKEAQVDSKELAAELEKLKASDSEFQELTAQLQVLNVEKERYAQQLAAALQVIGSFSASLAENLVATHELEDRISANLQALDHGALMHIKEMERRTRDRLVQYQYYLAKSFQYRQLRAYTGNLQLTRLFTRFQQLVEANNSHVLTEDEFDNLKGIFIDELRDLVAQSLDNVNAPSRSFPKTYRLNADQRRQLNEQGRVLLNLKDIGLINPGDENVRLADLRTRTLAVTPTGPVGSLALVRVNYEHAGISRLTTGGRTFLFRHYQTESVNPITWNAIYDAHTGQTVNSTLSAAQQSLISVLLALQPVPVTNLLFFSQPAANAEILLTKDVSSDNGTGFVIDDLLFEIQYDFNATSGNQRELNVRVSGDLASVIVLSPADINSRADGIGDFSRIYPSFTVVTLQAPATYGQHIFDKWMLNNQPYSTFPVAAVVLSGNAQVEARYRLPVIARIAMAPAPRGQIRFTIPSETGATYTLESTPRLNNPTWSTVESRPGDGTTLEFNRTTTSPPNAFYRIRVDRQ